MEEYVKISKKELRRLLTQSIILEALEYAGVDNWQGWGEHWDFYYSEEDMEVFGVEDAYECLDEDVEVRLSEYEVIKNEN